MTIIPFAEVGKMDFTKLDKYMDRLTDRGIPFGDIIVTKDGETVYRRLVGYSDAKGKKPLDGSELYWLFSVSKVITCAMAMKLVEEGKIALDDPVSKYLPAYKNLFVRNKDKTVTAAQNEMRIVHLFTMTGGLDYNVTTPNIARAIERSGGDTVEVVSSFVETPLQFEPGEHYRYSLCHDVLGAVIEVASGMRFSEYVKKYLTEPLGMKNTGFKPTEEQLSRFATMFRYDNGTATSTPMELTNELILGENYESGGAGFFSNAEDMVKFITLLANGGVANNGYRLLRPETVQMMTKNYLTDPQRSEFVGTKFFGYGWGLCGRVHLDPVVSEALSPVGEFGWDGAAESYSLVDPFNRVGIFFGKQVQSCSYGHHKIDPTVRNLIYEGLGLGE